MSFLTHSNSSMALGFQKLLSLSLFASIGFTSETSTPSPPGLPLAHVRNGTYSGMHNSFYKQDLFLGIPYAQAPIGDLRFRVPVSLNSTWHGTKDAISYGDVCVSYGDPGPILASEDCLTLNVIRPAIKIHKSLPVIVWIHGGGLLEGSSADLRYNLSYIIHQSVLASKSIIGVSLNYRLAAFGFLWSKEVKSHGAGNLGLRDQRLALHWIQENIAAFGGDPERVTLWGESAGGYSIGKQLLAFGGRDDGLFRSALMESGFLGDNWPYAVKDIDEHNEALYNQLTKATGCSDLPSPLECLRALPFEELSKAQNSSEGAALLPWVIPIDGDFVQEYGSEAMKSARFVKIPILLGTNTDEGTVAGPGSIINTDKDFESSINLAGIDEDTVKVLTYLYPDIDAIGIPKSYNPPPEVQGLGRQYKRGAAFFGDAVEHAPRRLTSISWSNNNLKAYSFRWNIIPNGVPDYVAAAHFEEIPWVFGNLDGVGYDPNPFGDSEKYREVAKLMNRMWISFVVDGDPNFHGIEGVPHWPIYDAKTGVGRNFVFEGNSTHHVEVDEWRAAGIKFIMDRASSHWQF